MDRSTLSKIDLGTGAVTPIARLGLPPNFNAQVTNITGDAATHRIFALRLSVIAPPPPANVTMIFELLTINSQSGAPIAITTVNAPIGDLQFDPVSHALYALTSGGPQGVRGVVRLDPNTGSISTVASLPPAGAVIDSMAVSGQTHTIYVNRQDSSFPRPPDPPTRIITVDTVANAVVSTSPVLSRAIRSISYDTSSNKLFGVTECCPQDLLQIDPSSWTQTFVANVNNSTQQGFMFYQAVDPLSHTVFLPFEFFGPVPSETHISSVNNQTGASTLSPAIATGAASLYFETAAGPPVSTGTLYGLIFGSTLNIGTVDPLTAAITPGVNVGLPPGQPGPGFGPWANDPSTHRFFLVRVLTDFSTFPPTTTSQLLTVYPLTGTATISANLARTLSALVFDSAAGTLYGITNDNWIVRVEPNAAMTNLAAVTGDFFDMVVAPTSHALYVLSRTNGTVATRLLTMDTLSNFVTLGPLFTPPVRSLVYDTSLGALFGLTFCCPSGLVRIDPGSGAGTPIGAATLGLGSGFAIDSASHTVFVTQDVLGAFGPNQYIASINDQTGVKSLSPSIPSTTYVSRLLFEPQKTDTSPPTTSIGLAPALNAAGWNNTNVTVNLSATDPDGVTDVATISFSATGAQTIAPTVVAGGSASFVVNTEGVTTISYFAKDKAGNTETSKTQVIRIDKTLPTVTYTGNAGTYTVNQTVAITCTAVDPPNANGTPASGLASTTCANVNAPAYSFPLGPTTLSATATDVAGNLGTGSTTFTVQVTTDTLCALTVRLIETSPKFLSLSPQAQKHWDRFANRTCEIFDQGPGEHGPDDKAEKVAAYNKALTHLVGNGFLTPDQAAILLKLAQAVSL